MHGIYNDCSNELEMRITQSAAHAHSIIGERHLVTVDKGCYVYYGCGVFAYSA